MRTIQDSFELMSPKRANKGQNATIFTTAKCLFFLDAISEIVLAGLNDYTGR